MKSKFKVGDNITAKERFKGFERATIQKIYGNKCRLKIPCGFAIVPLKTIEECYIHI